MRKRVALGHNVVVRGWKLRVRMGEAGPIVEVDDMKGFAEEATLFADGAVHYKHPERVPAEVRAQVKSLYRRLLRDGMAEYN